MNQDTTIPQQTVDAAELDEDSDRKISSGPSEAPEKQDLFQGPLRRGHWTDAEMTYAEALIEAFQGGNLDDVKGECSTLRAYLAEKVHCSPKRISKKFESSGYYGRQTYRLAKASASIPTEAEISKQEESESRLQMLKGKFVESVGDYALEVQTKKKKDKPKKVRKLRSFQGDVRSVGVASPATGGVTQMASNDLGQHAAVMMGSFNHHMLGQLNPQASTAMNSASLGRLHSSFGGINAESLGLAPSSIHGLQLELLLQSLGPSFAAPPRANRLSLTTGYTPVDALLLATITNQMQVNQGQLRQLQAGTQMNPSAAGSNLLAVFADPTRQVIQTAPSSTVPADPTGMYVGGNTDNVRTKRDSAIADLIAGHFSTAKRTKYY